MDKLEVSEQMAKAIVEHLKKHEVGIEDNWLNIPMHEATLTTYIREAILDFEAEQSFQQSIKDHDETYERITGEKVKKVK